jgi:hypothetical protein
LRRISLIFSFLLFVDMAVLFDLRALFSPRESG